MSAEAGGWGSPWLIVKRAAVYSKYYHYFNAKTAVRVDYALYGAYSAPCIFAWPVVGLRVSAWGDEIRPLFMHWNPPAAVWARDRDCTDEDEILQRP